VAEQERNVDTLVVPRAGRVEGVTDGLVPYRVVDADGVELAAGVVPLRFVRAPDSTVTRLMGEAARERRVVWRTFDVEATAFLKNMVRILVGTLVDLGRGKLSAGAIDHMLRTGDRTAGGVTAPAHGLTLLRVSY